LGYQDNPIYTFVFDFYKLTRAGGEWKSLIRDYSVRLFATQYYYIA
jgi:hypothetical protein